MILPGAHARADRRRADALMRRSPELRRRDRRPHRGVRLRLPRADDRLRVGRVPAPGGRKPGPPQRARSSARKLAAQPFTWPHYFHRAPVGDVACVQRGRHDVPRTSGPTNPDLANERRAERAGDPRSSSGRTTRVSRSTTFRSMRSPRPARGSIPTSRPPTRRSSRAGSQPCGISRWRPCRS